MTIRTVDATVADDAITAFRDAVQKVAHLVCATQINEKSTTISKFRTQYSNVLDRTDKGSLEFISRNNRRYMIFNEDQLLAVANNGRPQRMAGDLLEGLQLLPATKARPCAISVNVPSVGRLPE